MKNGQELISKVNSLVERGFTLSLPAFKNSGITPYNISWLIDNGYIERRGRGIYRIKSKETVTLEEKKRIRKDLEEKENVAYGLLLEAIKRKDFEEAKEYAYSLYEISPYKDWVLLIIALINYLTSVDASYRKDIANLTARVTVSLEEGSNNIQTLAFKFALNASFSESKELFSNIPLKYRDKYYGLVELLLDINILNKRKFDYNIRDLITSQKIEKLAEVLEKRAEMCALPREYDPYIYMAIVYRDAMHNAKFPDTLEVEDGNVFTYIYANDFESAKRIISQNAEEGEDYRKSILYTMLNELTILKREIESGNLQSGNYEEEQLDTIRKTSDCTYSNISEIAATHGFSEDDTLIFKLLMAREAYINRSKLLGDKLAKEVERAQNKSMRVKRLLSEVRSKKNVYINSGRAYTITKN